MAQTTLVAAPWAGDFVNGLTSFIATRASNESRPISVVTRLPGCRLQDVSPWASYRRCSSFAKSELQSFACP